jgi:tripartite-type tricarboxylate transporter receptor subunit TctC
MRRWLGVLIAASLGLGWNSPATAQDYPVRSITTIVPFPAGGATDTLARFLGEPMRAILRQPVIIENRWWPILKAANIKVE